MTSHISSKKESAKPVLVLVTVCVVSALILSFVHQLTMSRITGKSNDTKQQLLYSLIPSHDCEQLSKLNSGLFNKISKAQAKATVEEVYLCSPLGSIFQIKASGYGSDIEYLFGISSGSITRLSVVSQSETPGLGAKVAGEQFLSQFASRNLGYNSYHTITGATISSSAVIDGLTDTVSFILSNLTIEEKSMLGAMP